MADIDDTFFLKNQKPLFRRDHKIYRANFAQILALRLSELMDTPLVYNVLYSKKEEVS